MTGITGKIAPVWLILSCTRLLPKTPKQPYSTPLFYNFLSSSCLKPGGSCQFSSFFDDLNTHTHKAQANSQWFFWKTFYGADILLTHWRPCHPKPAVQEYTALKHCNFLNSVNNALTVSYEHWVETSVLFYVVKYYICGFPRANFLGICCYFTDPFGRLCLSAPVILVTL